MVQHAGWMRAVARRMVAESADLIEAVAQALLEHHELSGQQVQAIIAATRTKGSPDAIPAA